MGVELRLYQYNNSNYVSADELFKEIFPYSSAPYTQWVKVNITDQPQGLAIHGKDYISFDEAGIKPKKRVRGGNKKVDYLLSAQFALQLCYQAKTLPAKKIKEFLYCFH